MRTIFTLFALLTTLGSYAQSTISSGQIKYKETLKLELDLSTDNPMFEQIKDQIPDERTTDKLLTFKDSESLYTNQPSKKEDKEVEIANDESLTIRMDFDVPEEIFYYNSSSKEGLQQRSFMGRTFLVSGEKTFKWKITGETKEILGYTCTKATTGDSIQTVAWFTSEIPVFSGPDVYAGLPGLILEVDIEEGKRVIQATDIDLADIETAIAKPTKGKKVNSEQFAKIMKKKMEEMRQEFGGSGNVMIITEEY